MSAHVLVAKADGILTLTLHRPERKNAVTVEMYDAMTAALQDASADPAVRVVLVHGAGDSFCAGNDLGDFLANPPTGDDSPVMRFLFAVVTFDKPLVAAVHGAAVGIGTTLLLHCDLAYAAEGAKFKMPFVQLGIVPEAGSTRLVREMVGHRKATELLTLGKVFGPHEAAAFGFVNEVVAPDALLATAQAAAAAMASLPPQAVRTTKALLRKPQEAALLDVVRAEGAAFMRQLQSPEAKEAMSAFFEKRKPDFSKLG